MASYPETIFGCSTIGENYKTTEQVQELVSVLKKTGVTHLDTAARYPPTAPGESERLMGENKFPDQFTVDTKVLLSSHDGKGSLSQEAIDKAVALQLPRLATDHVNVLYCHAPDPQTPLQEQLAAFDKHYKDGKFKHVSNAKLPSLYFLTADLTF